MIHYLKLQNFKQHQTLDVDFTSGLNVLQGENGRGKTTVLRAVLYALFGAAAAGKKDNLTLWGATAPMSVTLGLDLGQHGLVQIHRSHRAAAITDAEGVLLASGHSPATSFVETALGMDHKTFRSMLYAGQGDTQALLKMGAAGLQKRLEVIAQVEALDKVMSLLSADTAELSAELRLLEDLPNLNELDQRKDSLIAEVETLAAGKVAAEQAAESCRRRSAELTKQLRTELYPQRDQLNIWSERRRALTARLSTLVPELTRLEGAQPFNPDDGHQEQVEALRQALNTLDSLMLGARTAGNALDNADRRRQAAQIEYDNHAKLQPFVATSLDRIKAKEAAYETLQAASGEYATLRKVQTSCPACDRPYDPVAYASAMGRLHAAERSEQEASEAYRNASAELDRCLRESGLGVDQCRQYDTWAQSKAQELQKAEQDLLQAKAAYAQHRPPAELEQEKTETQTLIRNKEAEKAAWQRWDEGYRSVSQQVMQTRQEAEQVENLLAGLPADLPETIAATEATLQTAQLEQQTLAAACTDVGTAFVRATLELENVSKLLAETRQKWDRRSVSALRLARVNELGKYLRGNRARLMSDVWENLTHYASYLISAITSGRIHSLARDGDGEFTVTNSKPGEPVDELSGAEQSIVGLSLRIALANTFYGNSGFLLLDEVTADCSESNSASVAGMLQSLQSQIIMVTHRLGDSANAANVVVL
jgi:DNA repair exonuclease SbcCD ATPase subunit